MNDIERLSFEECLKDERVKAKIIEALKWRCMDSKDCVSMCTHAIIDLGLLLESMGCEIEEYT